jgi:uncharacterized membrane protein YebE (DUF533 family)
MGPVRAYSQLGGELEEMTMNAKSMLESFLGTVKDAAEQATGGQGLGGLAGNAKAAWDGQSTLAKGAIAGGLLGVLLGGSGTRGMAGSALKVGGAAVIGGLALKAWEDWKSGKSANDAEGPVALPEPAGTAFQPDDLAEADDLAARLLRAMVAASKADGHVTPDERARIDQALQKLDLGVEAQGLIAGELDAPLDVGHIAALARKPEEAAQIYAASVLAIGQGDAADKGYLAMLAARMGLDPELVAHLDARAAQMAA